MAAASTDILPTPCGCPGNGRNQVALTAFSDKGFFIPNSVSYVEFERDAEGAVTQVTLHGAGEPVAHARIGALAQ